MVSRRVALPLVVGLLLAPACVEEVTIGGDPDASAALDAPREVGKPPPRDASEPPPIVDGSAPGCEDGQVLSMGSCMKVAPMCSKADPEGPCPSGLVCMLGLCVTMTGTCSPKEPSGTCPSGSACEMGTCVADIKCVEKGDASDCPPDDLCAPTGFCLANPCAMMKCPDGPCCAIFEMDAYVPLCAMGKPCP